MDLIVEIIASLYFLLYFINVLFFNRRKDRILDNLKKAAIVGLEILPSDTQQFIEAVLQATLVLSI